MRSTTTAVEPDSPHDPSQGATVNQRDVIAFLGFPAAYGSTAGTVERIDQAETRAAIRLSQLLHR